MDTYLTISDQAVSGARFRTPAPMSLTGHARLEPAVARVARSIANPITWPSAGQMPVRTGAAQQDQGGCPAGFGGVDVTDTKFSLRLGPPSCSPPV